MSQGSAATIWFDTYAELRAVPGGALSTSKNVAVGRGKDTGGVFAWTTDTTAADDGGIVIVPTVTPRTGCWKRKFSGAVNVAWFGALGDGIDHSGAIRAAITAAGPLGHVWFPAGTHIVSSDAGHGWCLNLPNSITLSGAGRELSIIKLAPVQERSVRPISATGISGITIRNLTIDGNKSGQTAMGCGPPNCEQQFGVFLNGCTDVAIDNVSFRDTSGDCLYLFGGTTRVTVNRCTFSHSDRAGIHAQTFRDLIVRNCQFFDSGAFGHIYQELDSPMEQGYRAVVTGCEFVSSDPTIYQAYGVLFAGKQADMISSEIVIAGNTFRGLLKAIEMGIFSHGYAITGNTIKDCAEGIRSHVYNETYGFVSNSAVAIAGNQLNLSGGGGANNWGIFLANSTCAVVGGNTVCGSGFSPAIEALHSIGANISGNSVATTSAGATNGVSITRASDCAVTRNSISMPNDAGSRGIYLSDDSTHPASRVFVGGNQIAGTAGKAVLQGVIGGAEIGIGRNGSAPGLTPISDEGNGEHGFPRQDRWSFGGKKQTFGAGPPAAMQGTWAVGDRIINTSPVPNGYMGWVCVTAGDPGTWKGIDLIVP